MSETDLGEEIGKIRETVTLAFQFSDPKIVDVVAVGENYEEAERRAAQTQDLKLALAPFAVAWIDGARLKIKIRDFDRLVFVIQDAKFDLVSFTFSQIALAVGQAKTGRRCVAADLRKD